MSYTFEEGLKIFEEMKKRRVMNLKQGESFNCFICGEEVKDMKCNCGIVYRKEYDTESELDCILIDESKTEDKSVNDE